MMKYGDGLKPIIAHTIPSEGMDIHTIRITETVGPASLYGMFPPINDAGYSSLINGGFLK